MKDIVLTRIDDRLIHGQVVTAWIKHVNGNRIVIVDDPLAKDQFMQKVFKAAAPPRVVVDILSVEDASAALLGDPHGDEKVIVLVKTPVILERLLAADVRIKAVNLGGIGAKEGRKTLYRNISASEEELECMKRIVSKGIPIHLQLVPGERPVDLKSLI